MLLRRIQPDYSPEVVHARRRSTITLLALAIYVLACAGGLLVVEFIAPRASYSMLIVGIAVVLTGTWDWTGNFYLVIALLCPSAAVLARLGVNEHPRVATVVNNIGLGVLIPLTVLLVAAITGDLAMHGLGR